MLLSWDYYAMQYVVGKGNLEMFILGLAVKLDWALGISCSQGRNCRSTVCLCVGLTFVVVKYLRKNLGKGVVHWTKKSKWY